VDAWDLIRSSDEALQGIAEHIRKFWEPRMRGELARVLADPEEAQALKPIVREALVLHLVSGAI
jgi:formate dehydrogenase subunit delta